MFPKDSLVESSDVTYLKHPPADGADDEKLKD